MLNGNARGVDRTLAALEEVALRLYIWKDAYIMSDYSDSNEWHSKMY